MRVVQAFGRERSFTRRFRETNEAQFDANLETVRISTRYFPFVEFCGVVGVAMIIGIGGLFVDQGIVTVGTVAAFVLYLNNLFEPVQQLSQLYNTRAVGRRRAEQAVRAARHRRRRSRERPGAVDLPERGALAVDDVSFGYADGADVLHDVSLTRRARRARSRSSGRPAPGSRRWPS